MDYYSYKEKQCTYLDQGNLRLAFIEAHTESLKEVVDHLDFSSSDDVDQLAFMMWYNIEAMKPLLNDGYLMRRLDLADFGRRILACTPSLTMHPHYGGYTPLNGPRCSLTETVPYYDVLKFMGQFTASQEVYEACLLILEAMPEKLGHMILSPPEVMCLCSYNSEGVDTSRNRFREYVSPSYGFIKKAAFYDSIYQPEPSQSAQLHRYRKEMVMGSGTVADFGGGRKGREIRQLHLLDQIIHLHYYCSTRPINVEDIREKWGFTFEDITYVGMKELLSEVVKCNVNRVTEEEKDKEITHAVLETIRFVTPSDKSAIAMIFIDAYCYNSDAEATQRSVRKELILALYERNIVLIDSETTHNFMRDAVEAGCLWIVQFLVSKGCPTKNLPPYGNSRYHIKAMQLKEILEKKVYDHGLGEKWCLERVEARARVLAYLTENNLI